MRLWGGHRSKKLEGLLDDKRTTVSKAEEMGVGKGSHGPSK